MHTWKPRIAIVVSHPIQHFCPQYASFSKMGIAQIKVFFASALGYKKYLDSGFGQEIAWGNLYLEEFDHEFLNNGEIIQPSQDIDAEELDEALSQYGPQLIIGYGYFQKYQRRAHAWGIRNKVPLAYISDSERRQKRFVVKEWIKYPYLHKYYSAIDQFLTVGNANEEYYKHFGVPEKKLARMHFPIDIRVYEKAYSNKTFLREGVRARYSISNDEIVIAVVGKLVAWKSQQHIIEALKGLENSGTRIHLFIIGSGPMQSDWEKKAASLKNNSVHFVGFVKPEDLPSFYAAADIYIHPAAVEPHSLSISEAIYMGCPVIVSNRCGSYGLDDDVQEGKNGFVFEYGDISGLTRTIHLMVSEPTLRQQYGQNSHELAIAFQEKAHHGILQYLTKELTGNIHESSKETAL